jgi:hypothetical protein
MARVLEIISDESRWTRGSMARMADGTACLDPLATRFCAVGALYRAAGELLDGNGFHHALEAERFVLAANKEQHGLPSINDIDGREAVIALFKAALSQ